MRFTAGHPEFQVEESISFINFIDIVKGRSIVSAGVMNDGRLELGLSGGAQIRIFADPDTVINVVSTLNPDELPPVFINFGELGESVPLALIESKLQALRTLYAITFLVENGQEDDLIAFHREQPHGDVEASLLSEDARIFIESMSYGSWILTAWTKTKAAFKAIGTASLMIFERGREAQLRKLEADALIREHEAHRKAIENQRHQFELQKSKLDYLLVTAKKHGGKAARDLVQEQLDKALSVIVQPPGTPLPPPITSGNLLPAPRTPAASTTPETAISARAKKKPRSGPRKKK
jgi:hypothetical protein